MSRKKSIVWLSFDFAINSDYEGLYVWLDKHNAKECGATCAAFLYEYEGDLESSLRDDLNKAIKISKSEDRIYAVFKFEDRDTYGGKFIFGKRKQSVWEGFYKRETGTEEIDIEETE